MDNQSKFIEGIINLPIYAKYFIAILCDTILCIIFLYLAFYLKFEVFVSFKGPLLTSAIISVLMAISIFWISGLYQSIFRYSNISIIVSVSMAMFIYGSLFFFIFSLYGIDGVPRSVGLTQPMFLFFGISLSRLTVKSIISLKNKSKNSFLKKNVFIYGAGESGRQLFLALVNHREFKVVGFLDDSKKLQGRKVFNKNIYSPNFLNNLLKSNDISYVFLALPKIDRQTRNKIIKFLENHRISVKTLPSISEIVNGKIKVSDINDFNIEDLLNRNEVKPDINLLNLNTNFKVVAVSGAGGSIGSELCRQIIRLKPKKLILIELNEFSLYKILDELKNFNLNIEIVPLLINVQNQQKLERIFEIYQVNTVYHAAAYKHVTLVEENICEGLSNNIFGTLAITQASIKKGVSNLVLISSDKSVRPTNVMGDSKRLSELIMQAIYNYNKNLKTNFAIVRFGNVLESSGSVIPKFKKQIDKGGPVTLTHKEVTRYFMTTMEAAQLVIQAGAMGKYSEVFVLDMGNSIKIYDLIKKMISLSGLTVKDEDNIDGDIEITITGLKPGEKLYEELLIGNNPKKTHHPKILKIEENFIPFEKLEIDLNYLKKLLEQNDVFQVKKVLFKLIESYDPNSEIVDHIYIDEQKSKYKLIKNLPLNHINKL